MGQWVLHRGEKRAKRPKQRVRSTYLCRALGLSPSHDRVCQRLQSHGRRSLSGSWRRRAADAVARLQRALLWYLILGPGLLSYRFASGNCCSQCLRRLLHSLCCRDGMWCRNCRLIGYVFGRLTRAAPWSMLLATVPQSCVTTPKLYFTWSGDWGRSIKRGQLDILPSTTRNASSCKYEQYLQPFYQ